MTYLRANRRPKDTRARIIYTSLAIFIVLAIIMQVFLPHVVPSIFTSIFKPFWTARLSVSSGSLLSREALLAENERLKIALQEFEVRLDTIGAIEQENKLLKEMFGRAPVQQEISDSINSNSTSTDNSVENTDSVDYSFIRQRAEGRILSAVLMRPPFVAYDEFIIDIGQDYGVEVNDKVYAPGDVLIGRIVDVLGSTAKVSLYSSPGETYEISVGSSSDMATAVGRGGGQYEAVMSRDANVKDGDFVLAPSVSEKPFGVVTAVISDPAEPFETVLFASPVNIYSLRWVMVDTNR